MLDKSLNDFLCDLSSKDPTPGGGSASALAGAIGASLMAMVANLTIGKKKYKDEEPLMKEVLDEVEKLKAKLIKLIQEDAAAFDKVSAVFKMPKETEEDIQKRKIAMQDALKTAALTPYNIMENTYSVLKLYEKSLGHTNVSTISDMGVGVLYLKTALYGAWLNVKINLNDINDEDFLQKYRAKSNNLLSSGIKLAENIFDAVVKKL